MSMRNWVIAYNEHTDECRFMLLLEEWIPFKYCSTEDLQPDWEQIGLYEHREDAYDAFIGKSAMLKDSN
jgi:hypothetical protein